MTFEELRYLFAVSAHEQWIRTKTEMFNVAIEIPAAGILIIDTDSMEAWARRADKPFHELSYEDQQAALSDADKLLDHVATYMASQPNPEPGPLPEPEYVRVKSFNNHLNLRDEDGKDIGDLHSRAIIEAIGQHGDRIKVVGWVYGPLTEEVPREE